MKAHLLLYITALLLFSACSEQNEAKKVDKKLKQAFLLNLQHFNSESENYMSFPLWFDSKVIAKNKITKITRQLFHVSGNTPEESDDNQFDIREIKIYHFDASGTITHLKVTYFYDDRNICEVNFTYNSKLDRYGFCENVEREIIMKDEIGFIEAELPFHLFKLIKSSKKALTYYSLKDKQLHHYMINSAFQGPLSVDSILEPKSKDIICLGTPQLTTKIYQVTNKVHETNVKTFTYEDKQFKSMKRNDFPFVNKRQLVRDENGFASQLIDSLFSQNNFLTRTLFVFERNNLNLPKKIIRMKENSSSERIKISEEKIDYEYQTTN